MSVLTRRKIWSLPTPHSSDLMTFIAYSPTANTEESHWISRGDKNASLRSETIVKPDNHTSFNISWPGRSWAHVLFTVTTTHSGVYVLSSCTDRPFAPHPNHSHSPLALAPFPAQHTHTHAFVQKQRRNIDIAVQYNWFLGWLQQPGGRPTH